MEPKTIEHPKFVVKNRGYGTRVFYDANGRAVKLKTGEQKEVTLKEAVAARMRVSEEAGDTLQLFGVNEDVTSRMPKGQDTEGKPLPRVRLKQTVENVIEQKTKEADKKEGDGDKKPTHPKIPEDKKAKANDLAANIDDEKRANMALDLLSRVDTLGYHELLTEANKIIPSGKMNQRPTDNEIVNHLREIANHKKAGTETAGN